MHHPFYYFFSLDFPECITTAWPHQLKPRAVFWLSFLDSPSDWTLSDLFSAGSCWPAWLSTAPPAEAALWPRGGTAAGPRSAYHARKIPALPAPQTGGRQCPARSRDTPQSCWGSQTRSPPERGRNRERDVTEDVGTQNISVSVWLKLLRQQNNWWTLVFEGNTREMQYTSWL